MKTLKKQIAVAIIAHIIALKNTYTDVKAFINNGEPASTDDFCVLLDQVRNGKDKLTSAYTDDLDRWHITTLR